MVRSFIKRYLKQLIFSSQSIEYVLITQKNPKMRKYCMRMIQFSLFFAGSLTVIAQIPAKFIGTWDCESPTTEYGNLSSICTVTKDAVFMDYDEVNTNHKCDWVKLKSDTLIFEYSLNYETIRSWILVDSDSRIEGYSTWSEGETRVTCTRSEGEKQL